MRRPQQKHDKKASVCTREQVAARVLGVARDGLTQKQAVARIPRSHQ